MYIQSKTFLGDTVTIFSPKKIIFLACLTFLPNFMDISGQSSILSEQKKLERVKVAYAEAFEKVNTLFNSKNITLAKCDLFLRAFKQEKKLQVFAKNKTDEKFIEVVSYDFCVLSGQLGPKRMQGDNQVPEGVYFIDRFNPWSTFYLSLGLNYPNAYDKSKATKGNPGGDIFIHGNCVSVGCIPITDEYIKELYLMCLEAQNGGQNTIPVHIFPYRMEKYTSFIYANDKNKSFWQMLTPIYEYFETHKKVPSVTISSKGYVIK
jgi:murein L,D-transpeptidase YafK